MNSREIKERIRAALPIETYIGRFVSLKRFNRSYKGLCPFHKEKTPSFTVTPDKGIFHCFGCGRGGDIFAFVMEHDGVEFKEALEILGRAAGIDVTSLQRREKKDPAYELLMSVGRLYGEFLAGPGGEPYLKYLKGRGIGQAAIERFQIGASPDQWQFLSEKFPDQILSLEKASLIRKSEKSGKHFDFFRGRVMFPIRDSGGQVVGFGGRVLPGSDNPAKYMNSPESPFFQKSKNLYGLFENMSAIRKDRWAIVTEGYLDVIGLYEAGLESGVAPLGTALTNDHASELRRYADHVTLLLDGDAAGREAARRAASTLIGQGFQSTRIFFLPTGMDPFDLSRKFEGGAIRRFLESSVSSDTYLIFYTLFPDSLGRAFQAHADPQQPAELTRGILKLVTELAFDVPPGLEEKKAAVDRFFELFYGIEDRIIRQFYSQEAARILSIDVEVLNQQLEEREQQRGARRPGATDREKDYGKTESDWGRSGPNRSTSAPRGGDRIRGVLGPRGGQVSADSGPPVAEDGGSENPRGHREQETRSVAHESVRGAESDRDPAPDSAGGPRSRRSQDKREPDSEERRAIGQLVRCERSMMAQVIHHPELLTRNLEMLRKLDFEDQDSETLWRVLEDRFLSGDGWDSNVLLQSNLPSRVLQSFSALMMEEPSQNEKSDSSTTFRELALNHAILRCKKRMSEIRGQMVVADKLEESYLWQRYSALLKEQKDLEFQLRSQSARNPKKATQQGDFGPPTVEN